MRTTETTKWQYTGDINIEYGGDFLDLSTWDLGYVACVRVTDLDSACGFDGAVMVEHITILLDDKEKWLESLGFSGWAVDDVLQMDPDYRRLALAESLMSYGYYDPDDGWDGYRSHYAEVLQTEQDGPMSFDGWNAEKRVLSENLEGYIKSVHLS